MAERRTVMLARQQRRSMSPAEVRLWVVLRTRPDGLKFRRQHPAGPYSLDFYCPAARLAIEVDGSFHDRGNAPVRDDERDVALAAMGVATLRVRAEDVFRDLEAVVRLILGRCASPLHHRAGRGGPPPHAEHGED